MSLHYLGEHIDIHTGGIDLRFPHHENERAQSNAVTGHDVVRQWVHGEHLLFEGRKMAKSTGNVVLLSELTARGLDPLALRLAFLEHRYRQQMNLGWDTLEAADKTLRRWRERVASWACSPSAVMPSRYTDAVTAAFDNDLDTATGLRTLRALERDESVPPGARFEAFAHLDQLLGLDLARDVGKPTMAPQLPEGAAALLEARARAREARDWPGSDRLRDELAALGVTVADTPEGQSWTVRLRPTPPHRAAGVAASASDPGRHLGTGTRPGSTSSSPAKNGATSSRPRKVTFSAISRLSRRPISAMASAAMSDAGWDNAR
jgi:cysteinyl-tRNA synthetase